MGDSERWFAAACSAMEGLGPRRLQRLRGRFGSWQALWTAGPAAWADDGVPPDLVSRWRAQYRADTPERLRASCERHGLTLLVLGDAAYPPGLADLHGPPPVLYVRGDPSFLAAAAVTVVGTRRATPYGLRAARSIAEAVAAAGGIVVSGMAFGIDACAHEAALAAGGVTAAVLAGGAERSSPRSLRALYERIVSRGVVASEYPPGTTPERGRFHARNRLLAALSRVTVVVEAPLDSGALITAERALELQRPVMAVPAPMEAPTFRGCLALLRDGADCVSDPADVVRTVGLTPRGAAGSGPRDGAAFLTSSESLVYALLDVGRSVSVEWVVRRSGLPPTRAVSALASLELRGLCIRRGGSVWRVEAETEDGIRRRA